ncbi:vWA domain-containing protein [Actinoplanes utahensis]|uniref:VWFA domain-containing protein n=1 Tax=Actinoplanes utahensis TaxID=1869 RepID=A0A0A6UCJ1_ACTUT|nr:vWA domain-containing protein [Actinoplanes utahensis]KHD71999.1 hypothetical protein MB27_42535 [Actinoplanes utahensis]
MAVTIGLANLGLAFYALDAVENRWVKLTAAMMAAAVGLSAAGFVEFHTRLIDGIVPPGPMRSRPAVAAAAATIMVAAAIVTVLELTRADGACPQALELRVLTAPEGVPAVRELTHEYALVTARANNGCPAVYPYVYAAGTATVSGALARRWADAATERPLEQIGPRPDLWLPDSVLDVRRVQDIVVKGALPTPLERVTSIATSPIVLAGTDVPDVPDSDTHTLPELVSALLSRTDRQPSLAAPDPAASPAGLLAADVYLRGAGGELVGPDVAHRRARVVFDSTDSAADEAGVLCAFLREGKAPPAVLTSLRTWQRFAAGRALGGGCQVPLPAPADLPEPVVLKSAPALDHPFVQFTWTGERQRRAVEGFRDWLRSEDADAHLSAAGLGEPHPACSDLDLNACVPHDPDRTLALYEKAKRPGRVLLAVDASGSMAEAGRFTVAVQGVGQALGRLGPSDEVGLWSFPAARGRGSYELVAVAPGSDRHRRAVTDTLRTVRPAGVTPLYDTVLDGMGSLAARPGGDRIRAMVVLTDGEDSGGGPGLRATVDRVRRLAAAGIRLYVIATGEARCDNLQGAGPLYQLARAGRGECLRAAPEAVPETMARLFENLWSGQ